MYINIYLKGSVILIYIILILIKKTLKSCSKHIENKF